MKIIITGCCGFIGTNLSLYLLKNTNYKIIGIDNFLDNYDIKIKEKNLQDLENYSNFIFHRKNIRDFKFPKVDKIIHLAAIPGVRRSLEEPIFYLKNNLETFIYLLEECRKKEIKDVIYASSSSVYGDNQKTPFSESDEIINLRSSYACSKKCMEVYAKYYSDVFGINTYGLRFFTVYGPRGRPDMAPYIFIKNIMEGNEIKQYGDGSSLRDYTYINDILEGIMSIINGNGQAGEIYNLGYGNPIKLTDFIKTIEEVVGKKAILKIEDNKLGDVPRTFACIKKSKKELNYEPKTKLKKGLHDTYLWLKEYLNKNE